MVFCKSSSIPTCENKVNVKLLEQVHPFAYLGSVFTANGRCEKEVKRRLVIEKTAFNEESMCGRSINIVRFPSRDDRSSDV